MDQPRIAILVDADNVQSGHIDFAVTRVRKHGAIVLKRAFGRLSSINGHSEKLEAHGFTAEIAFPAGNGKNAADLMLTQYATRLAERRIVDIVALVSSDGDFGPIATGLAEAGLRTIGFGRADTPPALKNACGLFVPIPAPQPAAPKPAVAKPAAPKPASSKPQAPVAPPALSKADASKLAAEFDKAIAAGSPRLVELGMKLKEALGHDYKKRFRVKLLTELIPLVPGYACRGDGAGAVVVRLPVATVVNLKARPAASG